MVTVAINGLAVLGGVTLGIVIGCVVYGVLYGRHTDWD